MPRDKMTMKARAVLGILMDYVSTPVPALRAPCQRPARDGSSEVPSTGHLDRTPVPTP